MRKTYKLTTWDMLTIEAALLHIARVKKPNPELEAQTPLVRAQTLALADKIARAKTMVLR